MAKKEVALYPDIEEWFEEYGVEAMDTMAELLKVQQQTALELTKLVLEHCKEDNMTKERLFTIFKEASEFVMKEPKPMI